MLEAMFSGLGQSRRKGGLNVMSGKPFGRDRRIVQLAWMMVAAVLVHYQVNGNNNNNNV